MSNKKEKVPKTKVKESRFIPLSKVQSNYLKELRARHIEERERALKVVYEELDIMEKILKAPLGTYQLREDLSGLDVLPVEPSGKDN